jgi:hypothetical protein
MRDNSAAGEIPTMRAAAYGDEEKVSREAVDKLRLIGLIMKKGKLCLQGNNSHSIDSLDAIIDAHNRRWLSRKNAIYMESMMPRCNLR